MRAPADVENRDLPPVMTTAVVRPGRSGTVVAAGADGSIGRCSQLGEQRAAVPTWEEPTAMAATPMSMKKRNKNSRFTICTGKNIVSVQNALHQRIKILSIFNKFNFNRQIKERQLGNR